MSLLNEFGRPDRASARATSSSTSMFFVVVLPHEPVTPITRRARARAVPGARGRRARGAGRRCRRTGASRGQVARASARSRRPTSQQHARGARVDAPRARSGCRRSSGPRSATKSSPARQRARVGADAAARAAARRRAASVAPVGSPSRPGSVKRASPSTSARPRGRRTRASSVPMVCVVSWPLPAISTTSPRARARHARADRARGGRARRSRSRRAPAPCPATISREDARAGPRCAGCRSSRSRGRRAADDARPSARACPVAVAAAAEDAR